MFLISLIKYSIHNQPFLTSLFLGFVSLHFSSFDGNERNDFKNDQVSFPCPLTNKSITESDWFKLVSESRYDSIHVTKSETSSTQARLSDEEQDVIRKRIYANRPALLSLEYNLKNQLLICIMITEPDNSLIGNLIKSRFENHPGYHVVLFSKLRSINEVVSYLLNHRSPTGEFMIENYNSILITDDKIFIHDRNLIKFMNDNLIMNQDIIVVSNIDDCSSNNPVFILISQKMIEKCCNYENHFSNFSHGCMTNECVQKSIQTPVYNVMYDESDEFSIDYIKFNQAVISFPVYTLQVYLDFIQIQFDFYYHQTLNQINSVENQLESYATELTKSDGNSSKNDRNYTINTHWPVYLEKMNLPSTRFDVIRWKLIRDNSLFLPNDFDTISSLSHDQMIDVQELKSSCIQYLNRTFSHDIITTLVNGNGLKFNSIYYRFHPRIGMEYKIDMELSYNNKMELSNQNKIELSNGNKMELSNGNKMELSNEIRGSQLIQIEAIKPLNLIKIDENVAIVDERSKVILIVPIKGSIQIKDAIIFTSNYFRHVINRHVTNRVHRRDTMILFLLTPDGDEVATFDVFLDLKIIINNIKNRVKYLDVSFLSLNYTTNDPLDYLVDIIRSNEIFQNNFTLSRDIIFHLESPSLIISSSFLNRIKMNTIKTRQIFVPIPFQEFKLRQNLHFTLPLHPNLHQSNDGTTTDFDVNQISGYFDENHFHSFSFYSSDLLNILEHSNVSSILQLFKSLEKDTNEENVSILRAIDPGLKKFYREIDCKADQSCLHHKRMSMGSKSQLAQIVLKLLKRV